jgi:hypothetical protein
VPLTSIDIILELGTASEKTGNLAAQSKLDNKPILDYHGLPTGYTGSLLKQFG